MGKFWKRSFAFLFASFLILCGCSQNHTQPDYEVVTSVEILTVRNNQPLRRYYTTSKKMQAILMYLRTLPHQPLSQPIAEPASEDTFLIIVGLSSGNRRYYRQARHRYISLQHSRWHSIQPIHAAKLYGLLRSFPSDRL